MAKRVTRKQLLKEPDEFITTTGKVIQWAKTNSQTLIIGTTAFFVLVLGLSVYGYFSQRGAATAQTVFSQVVTKYQEEVGKTNAVEALAAVGPEFDDFIKSYGGKPAGQLGRIYYGHINLAGKAYDQAILHYEKALNQFSSASSLANIILNGLASAYQQKGEHSKAIENYRKIAEGTHSILKDAALFNLGKLYEQTGKTEESKQAYQKLKDDFPKSMYTNMASEKGA